MAKFSDLETTSPATIAAARFVLGVDDIDGRLTTAEELLASGGGGSTLTLLPNSVITDEDTPVVGNVLANDTTTVGTLRVLQYWVLGSSIAHLPGTTVTLPGGAGDLVIQSDGEWSYTPALNYNGVVPQIQYMATNGVDVRLSYLQLEVSSVDDPPVANTNAAMTDINQPVTFGVLGNDFDPEGQSVVLTHINGAPLVLSTPITVPNGTVVVAPVTFAITYTPTVDYSGTTSFTYTISDGVLSSNGSVYIQVGFENIPLLSPIAPIIEGDYFDETAVNFGNTAMGRVGTAYNNGVNVTEATYTSQYGAFDLGTREPWLYDRATQIYKLYLRTQDPTIRAQALTYAEQYMSGVVVTFDTADFTTGGGQAGDPKYLYPIIAWWYEQETGNTQYRDVARKLYNQARISFPAPYQTGAALWTERNMTYTMQSCLAQYWLTGDDTALTHAEEYFDTLVSMAAATGAPLHPHSQHEGSSITTMITSPWMGALLVEALLQLYRTNGDTRIIGWIARYCDFIVNHGLYVNNEVPEFIGLRVPAYLAGTAAVFPDAGGPYGDSEHAYDVAMMLKKGIWAKEQLSESVTAMQAVVNELLVVARAVFNGWTRNTVGLPKYRVNPPRKYAWWFNGAYSNIYYAGVVPLGPINNVLPSIDGLRPVGSTLTVIPGTWAGNPSPTYTYQWLRDGVAIAGQTGTTYVTTEDDVGLAVTVVETATNTGGVVSRASSNSIVTTAVGSPVITSQPTTVLTPSGQDATFTLTATGSPTPSYQWYVRPAGNPTFSPISGATTNTLSLTGVSAAMSGNRYYCVVSNVGDTVTSDTVYLYVTAELDSIQFTASQGAVLTQALLAPGAANFTIEALVRFDAARVGGKVVLSNRYIADRQALWGTANNFPDYDVSIGDSQTGWTGGSLGSNPVTGQWYFITLSADPTLDTGLFRGTIQALSGGTTYVDTRDKGIDGILNHVGFEINGGGAASAGLSVSYQYVRAYASERSLVQIESDRTSADTTDALFWWVFEDNGSGGVTVRDATGNGRVPTLVGGTLSTGPTAPVL